MISIEDFMSFIDSLEEKTVRFDFNRSKTTWNSIDLRRFTADINEYKSFTEWWQSKRNVVKINIMARMLLDLNPPEKVKQALLFVML